MGTLMGAVIIFFWAILFPSSPPPSNFRLIYDPYLGWDSAPPMTPLEGNQSNFPVVYFLGDSFTEGKKWPQLSQDYAKEMGLQFSGYSLGVSGYGTIQSYLKLKELFDEKKPQLVVLLFYAGNDLRDNYNNPPIYYSYGGVQRPYIKKGKNSYEIVPLSVIYRLYMKLTHASFCPAFDQWNRKHLRSFKDPVSWAPFYRTNSQEDPYVQGAWEATEGALILLKSFLDERGVPLIVLGIDNPFSVDKDVYEKHVTPMHLDDFAADLPLTRLGGILKDLQIPFVICTPQLRKYAELSKEKVYEGPAGNLVGHFQLRGEEVVAKLALNEILKILRPKPEKK